MTQTDDELKKMGVTMTAVEEDYDEEIRRSKLHLIRDGLLCLELEGRPMKPTLLMYAMRIGWAPMVELVKHMSTKQLIEVIRPETTRRGRQLDRRSNARIGITLKGKYILRLLDEMLRYLADELPPQVNPPLWLMRKALETKGFTFMGELQNLQRQNLLEAPNYMDDPTPFGSFTIDKPDDSVIPTIPAHLSPSEREGIIFTLAEVNSLPPIRDYSPYEKVLGLAAGFYVVNRDAENLKAGFFAAESESQDLAAGFNMTPVIGLYCPECGYRANGLRGLSIHLGHMHPDKKKEVLDKIYRFQDSKVA